MSTDSHYIEPDPIEDLTVKKSITGRWGYPQIFSRGFVAVPTLFLQVYAKLKPYPLTPGEALFVLELMSFKWTIEAPFPSYKKLAERMNVSDKMVRRYAQGLETKSYLRREMRKNKSNLFDLSGLFKALYHTLGANDSQNFAETSFHDYVSKSIVEKED